jgi:hypothetical protein
MEEIKKVFKEDINFLEYPNWILDKRNKVNTWVIEKAHGKYEISSLKGLPTHFDKLVLYFLLSKLAEFQFDTLEINTTRYEIARNIFPQKKITGKDKFDRIMTSLRKWKSVAIHFEGVFFEGDSYKIRGFSIIDEYVLDKESKELYIRFNNAYIKQQKETKFYKLINFEQYKKLHKAASARLYEILVKNFKERNEWPINLQALAEKLTFEKREGAKAYYPSDVLKHLKSSINEINKKTDLCIDFKYNKDANICIFKQLKKRKETSIAKSDAWVPAAKDEANDSKKKKSMEKQLEECLNKFSLLPQEEKDEIRRAIKMNHFYQLQKDDNQRIFSYMTNNKLLKTDK